MMMLMIMKTTMLMVEYDIGKLYLSGVPASMAMLKKTKWFHCFIKNQNVYDNDDDDGIHAKNEWCGEKDFFGKKNWRKIQPKKGIKWPKMA